MLQPENICSKTPMISAPGKWRQAGVVGARASQSLGYHLMGLVTLVRSGVGRQSARMSRLIGVARV
jgi:hypothetical protein